MPCHCHIVCQPRILRSRLCVCVHVCPEVWNNWDNMKVFSEIPIRAIIAGGVDLVAFWSFIVRQFDHAFPQASGAATLMNGVLACFGLLFCDLVASSQHREVTKLCSRCAHVVLTLCSRCAHGRRLMAIIALGLRITDPFGNEVVPDCGLGTYCAALFWGLCRS